MTAEPFDPDFIESLRQQIKQTTADLALGPADPGLVPLRLECPMTSCKHGRHCLDYLRNPRAGDGPTQTGSCRDCGEAVVDLSALTDASTLAKPDAASQIILAQQHELIRAHYWHVRIDQWAYNQARRAGMTELNERVEERVRATLIDPGPYSGRGASYSKQILAYAQHATATCCRHCASYWHGMPADETKRPTEAQVRHAVTLAQLYLQIRLPELPAKPEAHVSSIFQRDLPSPAERQKLDEDTFARIGTGEDPTGLLVPQNTSLKINANRRTIALAGTLEFPSAS